MNRNHLTRRSGKAERSTLLLCLCLAVGFTSNTLYGQSAFAGDDTADDKKQSKAEKKEQKEKEKLLGGEKAAKDAGDVAGAHSAPCMSWLDPTVKPRICLLCIHGLGLYSGSYENLGKWLARHGVATYAIDVRGFGSWMKAKGDNDEIDFPACLNDIKTTLQSIRSANPGLPVYILGESMGGAISLRAAALFPDLIDGLVSSVPAGERFKQKKTDIKVALEFLTGPNRQHDMGKSVVSQATANTKLRSDWEDNPMDRMNFSAKQLMQFQSFMNENHDAAKLIKNTPVIILQGSEDKLVKPEGTWEIFNEVSSDDKIFLTVPSEHLIFEEQQDHTHKFDERVVRMLMTWFQTHLPAHYQWNDSIPVADHTGAQVNLIQGNYAAAITELDTQIAANPGEGKAYFLRGIAESKLNQPLKAKRDFSRAVTLGRGNDSAKHANEYLLSMAQSNKPSDSPDSAPSNNKIIIDKSLLSSLGVADQPAILVFYAAWAEQCKDIDKTAGQSGTLTRNIKFVKVDIDDPRWSGLIKTCNVGPIPTFVFVKKDGTLGRVSIGLNNFPSFAKGLVNSSGENSTKR